MEFQANEYVRQKDWSKALFLYNKLLENVHNTDAQLIKYLSSRSECLFQLGNHEGTIIDCRKIISFLSNENDILTDSQVRKRLLHALLLSKRFAEAEIVSSDWLEKLKHANEIPELKSFLETLLQQSNFEENYEFILNFLVTEIAVIMPSNNKLARKVERTSPMLSCTYCNVSFVDKNELRTHCKTELHEMTIMSDDGRDWQWRPPPRGSTSETYVICRNWEELGSCRFGIQCVEAHGEEELAEWKERFHYREMKLQRAKEKELFGKSYTEEFLEKLTQSPNHNLVMSDKLEEVDFSCTSSLSATVSTKNSQHNWMFFLNTKRPLRAVALLQDSHRNHFRIANISIKNVDIDVKNDQEWMSALPLTEEYKFTNEYRITVVFKTNIYGTFRQSVIFDFYSEPVLVKHLCVDVVPDTEIEKINEIRKEVTVSMSERWTPQNCDLVSFESCLINCSSNDEWETAVRSMYPCPEFNKFILSQTVNEKRFTKNNYKMRMHELILVEEVARYHLIARYNLTTVIQIRPSYILCPNSMAASTAKYSAHGELFASFSLGKELSEDTSEGRLILMHCNMVYLSPVVNENQETRKVYEAFIEDKGKNTIYLRLSANTVEQLKLIPDGEIEVQIQFQLNRTPYCEWHYILDRLSKINLIFPEIFNEPVIPWSPSRQWNKAYDRRLNVKQKEAIVAITTPLVIQLPPILVIGPFGTGKTFTLAQAIKELIKEPENRILLCTHSNSAADLYIKDYLHAWVEGGSENARPLRIYYKNRWVTTVNPIVQRYCCIKHNGDVRNFEIPSLEEIQKYKIVVVTLSTSIYLTAMGVLQGYFTHILIDEAAQAIECETVMPLALANEHTRIVLAGDHMQLGPDIFSSFARERNLQISLLERLYDHYTPQFPCKILLCENYRAHDSVVNFTSESFYEQKLVASGKQPRHNRYFPLTFFTTRGEDIQDKNSTAYYNNAEVYEVVERIIELRRTWPSDWGVFNEQSIGVVTPYVDQVIRIRSELRKKRVENVCVERVLNVQGKQFRAVILSTVRTRRTCIAEPSNEGEVDYGFLSNSKLLNTAITRAQSLVAVVGDPVALCSVGKCSKVWERFIQTCNENSSLVGITWTQLKLQLDGIELKKIYSLNPLAPEFYPRNYNKITNRLDLQIEPVNEITVASSMLVNHYQPQEFPYVSSVYQVCTKIPPEIPRPVYLAPPLPHPAFLPPLRFHGNPWTPVAPPPIHVTALPQHTPPIAVNALPQQLPPQNKIIPILSPPHIPPTQSQIPPQQQIKSPSQLTPQQQIKSPPQMHPSSKIHSSSQLHPPSQVHSQTQVHPASQVHPTSQVQPTSQVHPPPQINSSSQGHPSSQLDRLIRAHPPLQLPPQRQISSQPQMKSNLSQNISSNNKLIQFMSNVHFPEAPVLNDCINLLPQNMSLADMLLQPPNLQEKWYTFLKETTGYEAAEKFRYLLHTTNLKGSRVVNNTIFERTTPQLCESPTFNWYDSPNNQINYNKPVYMRENQNNAVIHLTNNQSEANVVPRSNPLYSRVVSNGRTTENDIQKKINEGFANLAISNEVSDVYIVFTNTNSTSSNSTSNASSNVGPRFYKYFN